VGRYTDEYSFTYDDCGFTVQVEGTVRGSTASGRVSEQVLTVDAAEYRLSRSATTLG
jgi:hypothetical protein